MQLTSALFALIAVLPSLFAAPTPALLDSDTTVPESLAERQDPVSPRYAGVRIVSRQTGKCISPLFYRNPGSWAWVGSVDCKDAKTWDIYEDGRVLVSAYPNLALDAGSYPSNNGLLKVSHQPMWFYGPAK